MIYDDLRVVDLSRGIAGAYCAKLLTDLGADVVFAQPIEDRLFTYLRTSQRHAADPQPWLRSADLVIVGEPDAASRAANPLVTVSITAVGHGGPDDGRVSTDEVLQARSGSLANHGHADLPPLTVAGNLGEFVTGAFAALGAVTAWWRASRTGAPEVVDVSMLEALQMTFNTAPTLMARFPGGRPSRGRWVMIPGNEPTGDDRYVGITTVTTQQWQALARVIGRDDMADDRELGTMFGRFLRANEVNPALNAYTTVHTAEEVVAACVDARIPAAIVGNGAELTNFDHLRERNVLVAQPGERWIRPRAPFRFHGVADRELVASSEADAAGAWPAGGAVTAEPVGERPLAGITVLDFTAFWAGPVSTAWLAAMGADVIKVEAVQRPDGIRFSAALRPDQDPQWYEKSVLFHASNLGKRGITLDLGHPDGLALAKRLVARADVIVENFTPRVLENFGLDYEVVRAIRPDIVMVRMPAFGLTGPWRNRPGFAQTMEQLTGMAWATGYEGGPPIIPGGLVDPMVGAHTALATVAALEHRARTGEGQLVEMPLLEVATAVTADQVIRFSADGTMAGRRGAGGVYATLGDDDWIAVDRTTDPLPPEARAAWCATRTPEEAAATLRAEGIAAEAMVRGYETLDDPQMKARGFFEPIDHSLVGVHEYPSWPMRMSAGPQRYWTGPAPTLGQFTDEVLRELGVTDDELTRLRDEHVIGTAPHFGWQSLPTLGGPLGRVTAVLDDDELAREQIEDALVDGDVAFERGTAQAALRHRDFRIVYFGTFSSNIGTWMQNVVLGAYAYKLTGSSAFVGLLYFAQLGPLLFLSTFGGLLADVVDRRRFLVGAQLAQLFFSFALAAVAIATHPSLVLITLCVFAVGIANALGAPGLNAILPTLVPREDLPGAVSLASVQMNLSRVIGPPIGALIFYKFNAAPVFAVNAVTYLFAVIGLLWATYPRHTNARVAEQGFARLLSGVRIARRDPVISQILVMLFSFSFFSLTFVGLFPVIAQQSFGIGTKSWQYGVLYACFGLGAALGAVSVGTVFVRISKVKLLRPSFFAFAVVLAAFALVRMAAFAYPVALLLGYAYFVAITALSTLIQSHLVDEERGRIMALWIMGFGGTVPLGVLVGGWIGHSVSITAVILAGAVWALVLAAWSNAKSLRAKGAPDV